MFIVSATRCGVCALWALLLNNPLLFAVCSYYQTESVLIALGITAAVCIAISIFAIQTKVCIDCWSGLLLETNRWPEIWWALRVIFSCPCWMRMVKIGPCMGYLSHSSRSSFCYVTGWYWPVGGSNGKFIYNIYEYVKYTIQYNIEYLTCSKKLMCSQVSPPHWTNRVIREKMN